MNGFTNFFFALFLTLALSLTHFSHGVSAAPLAVDAETLEKRDVWDPPVLYPHAGTVWKVGSHHNVTWNTTNPPAQITNKIGRVLLAKDGLQDYQNPLASNFSVLLGRVEVEVPNVEPGTGYQIVLFGDSGNYGQNFTIVA